MPFVARGAGTGLSGGAVPVAEGVVIGLSRMDAILDVDVPNRRVRLQPGVTNLDVTRAVAPHGLYYAPDPSSQQVCTIGGNVAENSGGAHCLKYGFTTNHVLEAELVLADGEIVRLDSWGALDLLGAVVGSEGTLGIVTEALVRVLPSPQRVETLLADFATTDAAGEAVSAIIAAGVIPAAIEMMDAAEHPRGRERAARRPADGRRRGAAGRAGRPGGGGRGDARPGGRDCASERAPAPCAGPRTRRSAPAFWRGRKAAFPAMGRLSRDYYVQDGVVPRTRLPETLRRIGELSEEHGLRVANVFHAGDGNLHPLVLYDGQVEGEAARAEELASQILMACLDAGGSLTGEHGVGLDKARHMPRMFSRGRPAGHAPPPLRVRPRRPVQPGQGVPDAAAVRRGARPLSPASAGAGGGDRPVVIEHAAGDLTCTVEAATPLAELDGVLAGAGQMLALDPPGAAELTVGEAFDRGAVRPARPPLRPAPRPGAGRPRPAAGRHRDPRAAARWSRTSPATTCPSCSPAPTARWASCWS